MVIKWYGMPTINLMRLCINNIGQMKVYNAMGRAAGPTKQHDIKHKRGSIFHVLQNSPNTF